MYAGRDALAGEGTVGGGNVARHCDSDLALDAELAELIRLQQFLNCDEVIDARVLPDETVSKAILAIPVAESSAPPELELLSQHKFRELWLTRPQIEAHVSEKTELQP